MVCVCPNNGEIVRVGQSVYFILFIYFFYNVLSQEKGSKDNMLWTPRQCWSGGCVLKGKYVHDFNFFL